MTPGEKIAVGYLRCSTDEQGSTSIPQQREEVQKWAIKNGFTIIDWYVDQGKSGTTFIKRPGFSKLWNAVENEPSFRYVLVYDESRWGRAMNSRENGYWKTHFERFAVKVHVINSSSKQEGDLASCITELLESAESSEYSKKLSRAVRRGMLSSQQGKYSRGGTAPYGYNRVAVDLTTGQRRELRPGSRCVPKIEKVVYALGDPLEVSTVKRIFEMKCSGLGYVSIADRLNAEDIPSPKRGRWRNRDQKWAGATVNAILENRGYLGERVYNRLSFSRFKAVEKGITDFSRFNDRPKIRNDKSEWIIVENAHPALVTREIFEKANGPRKMASPNGRARPNQHYYRSQYLLTGLITCSRCHFNYQGMHHKRTGNKYYVDGGFVNKGKTVCSYHSIRQDVLEEFVLQSLKETLLAPSMVKRIEDELRALWHEDRSQTSQDRLTDIEGQLRETDGKIANLVSLAENGMGLESISARIQQLEQRKKVLQLDLERLTNSVSAPSADGEAIIGAVRSFFEHFEERLAKVPIVEKKELIRMVVDKIIVDREGEQVHCYMKSLPDIKEVEELKKEGSWVDTVAPTGIEPVFEP